MTGLTFGEFVNIEEFKVGLELQRAARAAEIKAELEATATFFEPLVLPEFQGFRSPCKLKSFAEEITK
jgi:hypothetical protein